MLSAGCYKAGLCVAAGMSSQDAIETSRWTEEEMEVAKQGWLVLLCPSSVFELIALCSTKGRRMPLFFSWIYHVLGDSGGVVNSLDFCPASLKSLGRFYFRCVLSSQWKAVTVNLQILHCQF